MALLKTLAPAPDREHRAAQLKRELGGAGIGLDDAVQFIITPWPAVTLGGLQGSGVLRSLPGVFAQDVFGSLCLSHSLLAIRVKRMLDRGKRSG